MDISILIISYNVVDDLKECLSSIFGNIKDLSVEVIVVDNASKDGSSEMVKKDFPDCLVIESKENLGFAKANNLAYKSSKSKTLLFLNPDTIITGVGLKTGINKFMSDSTIGAMGPLLLNSDNTIQKGAIRKFPGVIDTIVRLTFLRKIPFVRDLAKNYRMRDFDFSTSSQVEQISGAAFFVKKDVFEKVGFFDENFFVFYEEVDLCKRIYENGFKIIYDPEINIIHKGGKSSENENGFVRAVNIRSLLYYFRKHLKGIKKLFFSLVFKAMFLIDLFLEIIADIIIEYFPAVSNKKRLKRKKKSDFRKYFLKNCFFDFLLHW